jgi:pantoate kinase
LCSFLFLSMIAHCAIILQTVVEAVSHRRHLFEVGLSAGKGDVAAILAGCCCI